MANSLKIIILFDVGDDDNLFSFSYNFSNLLTAVRKRKIEGSCLATAGNGKDAILDGAGIAVDILAAAIPIVPGGVGILRAGAKVANGADNVADATKAVNAADNAVTAAKNTSKLQESAKIGQEAHRQIEADLKHADPRIRTEVTIELDKKKTVRKDILKPTGTVGIIKPDTPSGHKSAERRVRLMNRYGYKTETFYYDPSDSRWLPNSPSYIGPKK